MNLQYWLIADLLKYVVEENEIETLDDLISCPEERGEESFTLEVLDDE